MTSSAWPVQGGDLLDWTSEAGINETAFLQRIEALSQLGYSVLLCVPILCARCAASTLSFAIVVTCSDASGKCVASGLAAGERTAALQLSCATDDSVTG